MCPVGPERPECAPYVPYALVFLRSLVCCRCAMPSVRPWPSPFCCAAHTRRQSLLSKVMKDILQIFCLCARFLFVERNGCDSPFHGRQCTTPTTAANFRTFVLSDLSSLFARTPVFCFGIYATKQWIKMQNECEKIIITALSLSFRLSSHYVGAAELAETE